MNIGPVTQLVVMNVFLLPGFIIGVVLCCGKGGDFIAGYNTASPREKAKWDEKALCRGTGVLVLSLMVCLEAASFGTVLKIAVLTWSGYILMTVLTLIGCVYINKSKRFRRKR